MDVKFYRNYTGTLGSFIKRVPSDLMNYTPSGKLKGVVVPSGCGKSKMASKYSNLIDCDKLIQKHKNFQWYDELLQARAQGLANTAWWRLNMIRDKMIQDMIEPEDDRILLVHGRSTLLYCKIAYLCSLVIQPNIRIEQMRNRLGDAVDVINENSTNVNKFDNCVVFENHQELANFILEMYIKC